MRVGQPVNVANDVSRSPTASGPNTTGGSTTSTGGAGTAPAVAGATNRTTEPVIGPARRPLPPASQTKDLVVGTGPRPWPSSTVKVNYVGADYTNGKVFDDSPWTSGQPAPFPLSGWCRVSPRASWA